MDGAVIADMRLIPAAPRLPWGMTGSVLLHAGLLAALFLLTPIRSFVVPEPPAISVDLIPFTAFDTAPEPEAEQAAPPQVGSPPEPATLPSEAAVAEPASAEPAVAGAPAREADGTFRATKLYAATLLTQPEMAQVRRGLGTLASSEKVTQLCSIEALEQIRLADTSTDPDTLVSYAMSVPISSGLTLTALGGAFRSRRQWYNISFQCEALPRLDGVASFSFKLGERIPESEWEEHDLNAEDKAE